MVRIVEQDFSNLVVRTADGLRVAVAGLPSDMPVDVEGVVIDAMTVADLRGLPSLPQPLRIRIAYQVLPDSRVHVEAAGPGER
jgi:hypothetical protein